MIWTNPVAAVALAAAVVPALIHLLTRLRAPKAVFPTLRFLPVVASAAFRRRQLEDTVLLAIRTAIVLAAVAACAGPFFATADRRRAWDVRVIRAEIVDDPSSSVRPGDRLPRAVAWLESQPPGRREIVMRSTFPIGAILPADLSVVPPHIGLRFERTGRLPAPRATPAPPAITVETESPVEIVTPPDERKTADELIRSLLADGLPAAAANRTARIVLTSSLPDVEPLRQAWMADAAARIGRDTTEWSARGGVVPPLKFGVASDRLVVAAQTSLSDAFGRKLVASVFDALAYQPRPWNAETISLTDAQLRGWERRPGPAPIPAPRAIERDDRRWLWALVLALLGLETLVRRDKGREAEERRRVA